MKKARKERHSKLQPVHTSLNVRHCESLDQLAEMRCSTRSTLIREAVFQYLIRELNKEGMVQKGFHTTERNLSNLIGIW
ncbi:ribbon-helix-helix protein, CopG family [Desulfopila sp. IMCC35006]|uniref:ribbon-helix-helix protein, CopG family n=1 Tax=Desulfopila sp. IMCC35006 TaxID=2569542 RepID=UPI0010AC19BF|nr:ribbon-helix-helix protein, CopG family [Desulfopila sp. IMCC35006]TKB23187.1 ribbon-helix-helix protein, CopG family [Desulfopila sp. IMCC35006]